MVESNGAADKLTALFCFGIFSGSFEDEHEHEHEDEPLVAASPLWVSVVIALTNAPVPAMSHPEQSEFPQN